MSPILTKPNEARAALEAPDDKEAAMGIPINCEGCVYYRPFNRAGSEKLFCCHYLLDNGKRREKNGDICLSRSEEREKNDNPFDIPAPQR